MQGKGTTWGYLLGQWQSQGWNAGPRHTAPALAQGHATTRWERAGEHACHGQTWGQVIKCLQSCFYFKATKWSATPSKSPCLLAALNPKKHEDIVKDTTSWSISNLQNAICYVSSCWLKDSILKQSVSMEIMI